MSRWLRQLTAVQNLMIGQKLSEYHTGYRAFSRKLLLELPLEENDEDFVFDNQMLVQCIAFGFPIAHRVGGLDFSFAGLKTALLYKVRDLGEAEAQRRRADLAASYQHAIVEALALRCERGLQQTGRDTLAIGGGVSANGPLRERLGRLGVRLHVPPRELCTDNAAMIASAARFTDAVEFPAYLGLDAYATA